MLAPQLLPTLALDLVAAYLCLLGPGQAWWRGHGSSAPRLLTRVAISVAWTTVLGVVLAGVAAFSLPRLILINGAITLTGYLAVARVRILGVGEARRPGIGPLVALAALALYWPPYESHFAGSDASAYLAAGVHLATTHRLDKEDPLPGQLYPQARREIFGSALGHQWKPPYTRMPGGMVIDTPDAAVAHPNFFPAPSVWSALFTSTLGPRLAGGFAPLFAALAGWAFWSCVRRRTGGLAALSITALATLNAAAYWTARLPMSEPLAWFLLWAGLSAMEAWEADGFPADGRIAGLLLGAVGFVRIEYALFIAVALGLRSLFSATLGARPLTPGLLFGFASITALTFAEVALIHGAYATPIVDALQGVRYRLLVAWPERPWTLAGTALACLTVLLGSVRAAGIRRTLLAAGIGGFVLAYTLLASHPHMLRSVGWLAAYLGWPALLLAAAGIRRSWRLRQAVPGDGFLVLLFALVAGLLVYDPHVYPAMPWAARRFAPLVIPAVLLLAGVAAGGIVRRSWLVGTGAWVLLALGVLVPARPLWGHAYFRGAYDQLQEFNALIPQDGVMLIDTRLAPFVLGTPLWLAHDRNSLAVDAMSKDGRRVISGITFALEPKQKVFLLKSTLSPQEPIPFVRQVKAADYVFQILLPEQTDAAPPRLRQNYTAAVSLYELVPWRPAPGAGPAIKLQPPASPAG